MSGPPNELLDGTSPIYNSLIRQQPYASEQIKVKVHLSSAQVATNHCQIVARLFCLAYASPVLSKAPCFLKCTTA